MSAKLDKAIDAVNKLDSVELNGLVDAIKRRRTVLYAQAIGQFSKDDVVTFTGPLLDNDFSEFTNTNYHELVKL